MNFSLYIAKKYLKSASKSNAINIINGIATVGIVVGVAVLFFVLSVFSGLIDFSLSFGNAIDPDLKIVPKTGKYFYISEQQVVGLKNNTSIANFSKIIEERVLFSFNEKDQVTYLKGVDTNFVKVSNIQQKVLDSTWISPNTREVIVGAGTANKLGLGLYDANNQLEVFVPKPGDGTIDNPDDAFNKANLVPIGVFSISDEYDSKYVFADLALTQAILEYKSNQISAIELVLKPNSNEKKTIQELETIFENKIIVKNKLQLNDALHKMLQTENIALYLIFTLVIIIFMFNLVGALIMMILEKHNNLKTLYFIGAEVNELRKIFLFQGSLLCVFGSILGIILGTVLVLLQQKFSFLMVTENFAYPVKFTFQNIAIVLVTVIPLGFVAAYIASSRINKTFLETK